MISRHSGSANEGRQVDFDLSHLDHQQQQPRVHQPGVAPQAPARAILRGPGFGEARDVRTEAEADLASIHRIVWPESHQLPSLASAMIPHQRFRMPTTSTTVRGARMGDFIAQSPLASLVARRMLDVDQDPLYIPIPPPVEENTRVAARAVLQESHNREAGQYTPAVARELAQAARVITPHTRAAGAAGKSS
jgi:hypothetical protein